MITRRCWAHLKCYSHGYWHSNVWIAKLCHAGIALTFVCKHAARDGILIFDIHVAGVDWGQADCSACQIPAA